MIVITKFTLLGFVVLLISTSPLGWSVRPAPSVIGDPLPLRFLHVDNGVLKYPDGLEVALMGVNYYGHASMQYVNMKARLPSLADRKAAIDHDFEDLKRLGVQVVRVAAYDREISSWNGALVDNEELDLIQYVIARCHENNMYCYFTLITYWWTNDTVSIGSSFSGRNAKQELFYVQEAINWQKEYIRQLLSMTNTYSGIKHVNDPTIAVIEILNEPWYISYEQLKNPDLIPDWQRGATWTWQRMITDGGLQSDFDAWRGTHGGLADNNENYNQYQRERVQSYIGTMYNTIRVTGAIQPVVYSVFGGSSDDDMSQIHNILPVIAESPIEAVCMAQYWPNLGETENDNMNMLGSMAPRPISTQIDSKARLTYEFDAVGTHLSCSAYPAIARRYRMMGSQIACQFQYDTSVTADMNQDWYFHYLNYYYTPAKAASLAAAIRCFNLLPREQNYSIPNDNQVWTDTGVQTTSTLVNTDLTGDALWGKDLLKLYVGWDSVNLYLAVSQSGITDCSADIWIAAGKGSTCTQANQLAWKKRISFSGWNPDFVFYWYPSPVNYAAYRINSNTSDQPLTGMTGRQIDTSMFEMSINWNSIGFSTGQTLRIAVTSSGNYWSAFDAMPDQTSGPTGGSSNDTLNKTILVSCDTNLDGMQDFGPGSWSNAYSNSFAASFEHNNVFASASNLWINALPISTWMPLVVPENPSLVFSAGSSPFFNYAGNGLVRLEAKGNTYSLFIPPDMEKLGPCLTGKGETMVARLQNRSYSFQLNLQNLISYRAFRKNADGTETEMPVMDRAFVVTPDTYELRDLFTPSHIADWLSY